MTTQTLPLVRRARGLLSGLRASGLSWTAGSQVVVTLVSLGSAPLLARTVGAAGRGDVAAVMTTLTVLGWICFMGLPQSCGFHFISRMDRSSLEAAVLAAVLGVVAAVAVWAAAPGFAAGHGPEVVRSLRVGALMMPLVGVGQCGQEILYARGSLRAWNVLRSVPVAGASVSVIVLYLFGHLTTASALVANLAALGCWALVGAGYLARQNWGRGRELTRRRVLGYAGQTWLAAASLALFGRLDQLLMVPLGNPAELGRYAVAVTVVGAANVLPSAIGIVAYPAARSIGAVELAATWRGSRRRLLGVGVATNLVVVLAAPVLLPVVFGSDFSNLQVVVGLLAVGQLLNDVWLLRVSVLNGSGRPTSAITPSWISTGVCVALLVTLSGGGISAIDAALATAISAVVRPLVARVVSGPVAELLAPR